MKKLICILALWFLVDWVYTAKLKPFIFSEFGIAINKNRTDSLAAGSDTLVGPAVKYVYGLDISHNQDKEIDWLKTKSGQFQFVICKATEGLTYKDDEFENYWPLLKQQGIIRGAYHFYRCGDEPAAQADSFVKRVGAFLKTDLPPILDFETENVWLKNGTHITNCIGADTRVTSQDLLTFLKRVQQLTDRRPMIYVNTSNGESFLTDTAFAAYPLWIATSNVNQLTARHIPPAWKGKWTFWQKSHNYDFDNNPGNDLDVFDGDKNALTAFINTTIIQP